jgi:hypothetical protein
MQHGILSSVSASMQLGVSGFSTVTALTWFTAQAQTVQHGRRLQLSEQQLAETILACGLTEHTCITLTLHFLLFITVEELLTQMEA